ncbi:helix-turn-helix domain-containing protein [Pseudomonas rhodesiae]|uniref:helix-turn-helix domain-containing protein n=1 Tax=Pseudomonas rhodesiae TaxID=76760 RepID=UPI0034A3CC92
MTQSQTVAPLSVGPETAATMTGHTRSGIYTAIAAGELKAFKLGKRRLILVKELECWINRMAKEGAR